MKDTKMYKIKLINNTYFDYKQKSIFSEVLEYSFDYTYCNKISEVQSLPIGILLFVRNSTFYRRSFFFLFIFI